MAGLVEAVVLLRPSFDGPWFHPAGMGRDASEPQFGPAVRCVGEPSHRVDEADPLYGDVLPTGGLAHHQADEVVHQRVHRQFFRHPVDGLAPQHVHPQRLLEVPEVGLDLPPPPVQVGQCRGRVTLRIQQRGDQRDDAGAAAAAGDGEPQFEREKWCQREKNGRKMVSVHVFSVFGGRPRGRVTSGMPSRLAV